MPKVKSIKPLLMQQSIPEFFSIKFVKIL